MTAPNTPVLGVTIDMETIDWRNEIGDMLRDRCLGRFGTFSNDQARHLLGAVHRKKEDFLVGKEPSFVERALGWYHWLILFNQKLEQDGIKNEFLGIAREIHALLSNSAKRQEYKISNGTWQNPRTRFAEYLKGGYLPLSVFRVEHTRIYQILAENGRPEFLEAIQALYERARQVADSIESIDLREEVESV